MSEFALDALFFLIVTALQRFGYRGRGIAAPDHRKVLRRVARAEVEAVRRSEGYGNCAGESVWGVESAQPFLAGDQQCRVVAAIGDQPHRFAHQLAGQPPAAEFGSRRHAVDIGRAAQLAFERQQVEHRRRAAFVFGREHAAAAVVAYQERVDELFVVAEGRGPQLFAGDFVGVQVYGREFVLDDGCSSVSGTSR